MKQSFIAMHSIIQSVLPNIDINAYPLIPREKMTEIAEALTNAGYIVEWDNGSAYVEDSPESRRNGYWSGLIIDYSMENDGSQGWWLHFEDGPIEIEDPIRC